MQLRNHPLSCGEKRLIKFSSFFFVLSSTRIETKHRRAEKERKKDSRLGGRHTATTHIDVTGTYPTSTKMTRRALCLLLACVPRALSATRAASAEDAVARMYSFWCTESHQAQAVCRRRALIDQYNAATSAKERKPILVSLHALSKSEASKTYTAMKKQFCSTADAKALPICTDHGGMWVDDAVFEWLCVKPDLSTDQRRMCERQDVARKLRGLTNTTARKELLKWPHRPWTVTRP